jgi:hypothetical protein
MKNPSLGFFKNKLEVFPEKPYPMVFFPKKPREEKP